VTQRVLVPLRWGDLDAQGHVNNSRLADYLQEARADFFLGGLAESLLTTGVVVVQQQIEYHAPLHFSEIPIVVELAAARVSAVRFTLAYTVWQDDRVVAVARTKLCPYNLKTAEPRRLAPHERTWLNGQVEPAEPLRTLVWRPLGRQARVTPLRIRWSDIDEYGHVNNVMFFDYVQEGRIAFTAAGTFPGAADQKHLWLVARQDLDYLAPIEFRREPYVVRTGVAQLGTTSLTFCSEVADPLDGRRLAQASTVAVFADADGRPTAILPEVRAVLESYRLG
jgi:acyl-CoA thioester hydrolase